MWVIGLMLGCGADVEVDPPAAKGVTWHADVAPVVAEHCAHCHVEGGPAPFALDTYESSAAWAELSLAKIEGDPQSPPYRMPPWFAVDTEECTSPAPWKGDERLDEAKIALFREWVDGGKAQGDPVPFPTVTRESLSGVTLTPDIAFDVPAEGEDLYRCVPVDAARAETGWITGLEVLPGDPSVVHHVVVFQDPTGAGPSRVDSTGSYPCFGGSGVPDEAVLFAWAPGADALEIPANAGIPMEPGSGLVMQIHYHPSGTATSDLTQLRVRWAESRPARTAQMEVFGVVFRADEDHPALVDPPFYVPAGSAEHEEQMVFGLDVPAGVDVRVWSVFSHMHLAGTDLKISLLRDSEEVCLAHNPTWDFDWQRTYVYDGDFEALPQVQPGDRLDLRCRYDNTMGNPALAEALAADGITAPFDFPAGESTTEEMCVAFIGVMY